MSLKKCSKCGEVKKVEEFSKKLNRLQSKCKKCVSEYHKEWYEKNSEWRRKQIRDYKKENMFAVREYRLNRQKLYLIDKARFISIFGEEKDLLKINDNEFLKIERALKIKSIDDSLSEKINLIKEVRNAIEQR